MPLEFIKFNGVEYPSHEAIGGASLWIRQLAQHYCIGVGLDVGYSKEKWMLPGAIGIEPSIDPTYDAMRLPNGQFEYLFSSHCLEHIKENVYNVLDYWMTKIKVGGILFLYLPHKSQEYWHPKNNRKHLHSFDGSEIGGYLSELGHKVWVSGCDFNHSFVVVCEKEELIQTGENYWNSILASIPTDVEITKNYFKAILKTIGQMIEVEYIKSGPGYIITKKRLV